MHTSFGSRLIHLLSVAKSFSGKGQAANVVFRPTTLSLPAHRRVAILGQRREGKTLLLQLLAGLVAPDQGQVMVPVRLSPVINSGGMFHPQLTGYENIRIFARIFGLRAEQLIMAVNAFSGPGSVLDRPLKTQDANQRKALEAAVALVLPFDCYLFDNVGQLAPETLERYVDSATGREAGVMFATSNARLTRQLADFVVVIRDRTLYPFSHIEEAIRFYER